MADSNTAMDPATVSVIAIAVAAVSEALPFTPLKGNGIIQCVLNILKEVFPKEGKK